MNRHLNELIDLVHNDQDIDSYTPELNALDKKLARAESKLTLIEAQINTLNSDIQKNDLEVVLFDNQLAELHKLLALNVKKLKNISTEKEMNALSIEEKIAKDNMTHANKEIDRLQAINKVKGSLLVELDDQVQILSQKFEEEKENVSIKKIKIEKSKLLLFAKREELTRNLEQKVLVFYEKIRIWAGNTAVVPVKKQACYGCYMKLNDKTYSEVIKADDICNCPHCGRILYIEPMIQEV